MKLIRLSANAYQLETSAGAILFSYEKIAAVRLNDSGMMFQAPHVPLSTATRAHLRRFSPREDGPFISLCIENFADACRRVLNAGDL